MSNINDINQNNVINFLHGGITDDGEERFSQFNFDDFECDNNLEDDAVLDYELFDEGKYKLFIYVLIY